MKRPLPPIHLPRNLAACGLLALLLVGCSSTQGPRPGVDGEVPRLGERMPTGSSIIGLAHKGRQLCSHWVEAHGVRYSFDIRCGTGIVVYVETSDPRFRTPEGVAIGDPLRVALSAPGGKLEIVYGECAVLLPSGWIAGIYERDVPAGGSCDELLGSAITHFETRFDKDAGRESRLPPA